VRGYVAADPQRSGVPSEADATLTATEVPDDKDDEDAEATHQAAIADHLFHTLRGTDNLVFANRRSAVEAYTDKLARRCTDARVPVEFLPHHGNLSKEIREHVEARLKSREAPVTAICTSTLEMGIDIGAVKSISQIGVPITVSSLRQRLGRSGRTDAEPSILRIYISERELNERMPPVDALRSELFQTVAMVELLLQKWYEPPDLSSMHLSTLVQQILSVIAERGGATARTLHGLLCGPGPFERVDTDTFRLLLQSMGKYDLLLQASDGLLLPGVRGERLLNHYSFYAVFQTLDEYRLVAEGRTLGSLPIDHPVVNGMLIIFGGRRWKVLDVDTSSKVINLERSKGGKPPSFPGGGGHVSDEVRQAMRQLYASDHVPIYLDRTAQRLLAEGRAAYQRQELANHAILGWGNDTLLFPWRGDKIMNTLAVAFAAHGHDVGQDGVALTLRGIDPNQLFHLIQSLATTQPPLVSDLAATVSVKANDKYDEYLDEPLLSAAYAARALDVSAAWATMRMLAELPPPDSVPLV
jgi:ATP-dependent Lhr-like helicase